MLPSEVSAECRSPRCLVLAKDPTVRSTVRSVLSDVDFCVVDTNGDPCALLLVVKMNEGPLKTADADCSYEPNAEKRRRRRNCPWRPATRALT
jgi:hypothetical protein